MLALIHDNSVIGQARPGDWVTLPNGSCVSPAQDGWSDDEHSLATIQPADDVPEGKRIVSTDVQLINGVPTYVHVLEDIPPPSVEDYQAAIVNVLDTKAQERRYDNAASISTYVNSTIPAWAAEATAYMAWRDQVWDYVYTQLDLVLTGQRAQPTIAEFLAELPTLTWPE